MSRAMRSRVRCPCWVPEAKVELVLLGAVAADLRMDVISFPHVGASRMTGFPDARTGAMRLP
ncbi:hypothetical protein ABB34_07930 [Stenotrophomonas daejeonensis]|uniref:Uncharacterized protein n=1 Tax=Stenotrophomonas daejeonensis TaxID=659018 RepID=A0A0R0DV03_9GAMM|nr:hypothetical protein ABB34_07930 [Stenotrophomonas daejeonensis]